MLAVVSLSGSDGETNCSLDKISTISDNIKLHCKIVVFFANASDAVNIRTKGLE